MLTVKRQVSRLIIIGNPREILPHYILTFQFTFVLLGGEYIISVGLDESLSHFAGIPAVLQTLHKLYSAITCEKFHLGKVGTSFALSGSCFSGTQFSHAIASARPSGMKK